MSKRLFDPTKFSSQTDEECAPCNLGISALTSMTAAGEPAPSGTTVNWEGVIGIENQMTGDGRLIQTGAMRWDETLPAPLRYVASDVGAHAGATDVGSIETVERLSDGRLWGTGVIDLNSKDGAEAARQVEKGVSNGVSMDLDDVTFEIRVAEELIAAQEEFMEALIGEEEPVEEAEPEEREVDENGLVTVGKMSASDEVMVTTDAQLRGATLVSIPAFVNARITLASNVPDDASEIDDEEEVIVEEEEEKEVAALLASGHRVEVSNDPPEAWFKNPEFTELTPLTVDEDGRVYGHLAAWGTCHISHAMEGSCITPPHTATDYSTFHLNPIRVAEGHDVAVGKITVDAKHAGEKLNAHQTLMHYDNTGTTAAFVRVGEDQFGPWVAGFVSPDATPKQRRTLRSSPLSGDWRNMRGNLELVAILSVNVPGFPVPRPSGLVASGKMMSLVASGMVPPKRVAAPGTDGALSLDDLKYLKMLAKREKTAQLRAKAETLASRVAEVRPSKKFDIEKVHALAKARKEGK